MEAVKWMGHPKTCRSFNFVLLLFPLNLSVNSRAGLFPCLSPLYLTNQSLYASQLFWAGFTIPDLSIRGSNEANSFSLNKGFMACYNYKHQKSGRSSEVERHLAEVEVAGSSPVARSILSFCAATIVQREPAFSRRFPIPLLLQFRCGFKSEVSEYAFGIR